MGQRLAVVRVPPDKLTVSPVAVRALDAGEAAVMDVHIVSTRGVDRKKALALLPAVRRAAAPFPNHGFAQAVLAEAEFDAGNFAEAEAAALRSVAADPKSRSGYLYHGMALAAQARSRSATAPDDATLKAIRAPLMRANRLDPDDPRPMLRIVDTYLMFGLPLPENAKDALIYAHNLAPEDRGARMLAAMAYIERGDLKTARAVIGPLAFDPHARAEGAMRLLAAIDAGPESARAALRGLTMPQDADDEGGDNGPDGATG